MKKKILGYYDYTVILTYCGMLFAFCGILSAIEHRFVDSLICLMFAGVCDLFDGTVAATKDRTESEKRFGIQIDSLSDLLSFGVLPAIFVYVISKGNSIVAIIAALYALCALIRLAFFNVMEEDRQKETEGAREKYLGIPVTTISILLPALYIFRLYKLCKRIVYFPILLTIIAIGFLSPLEIKKPKLVGKICMIFLGVIEIIALIMVRGGK